MSAYPSRPNTFVSVITSFIGLMIFYYVVFCNEYVVVYNEELLIALSFFAFCLSSGYTWGSLVSEALQTRRTDLRKELKQLFIIEEEILLESKHFFTFQKKLSKNAVSLHRISLCNIAHSYEYHNNALEKRVIEHTLKQIEQVRHKEQALSMSVHTITISSVHAMSKEICLKTKAKAPSSLLSRSLSTKIPAKADAEIPVAKIPAAKVSASKKTRKKKTP
jgi:predicted GIY-YIG superfamily endonuclease